MKYLSILFLLVLASCGGAGGNSVSNTAPQRIVQFELITPEYTQVISGVSHDCIEAWVFNFDLGEYALINVCRTNNSSVAKAFAEVGSFNDYASYTRLNVSKTTCDLPGITLTRSVNRNLGFINEDDGSITLIEAGIAKGPYSARVLTARVQITSIDWGCYLSDGSFYYNASADAELSRLGL